MKKYFFKLNFITLILLLIVMFTNILFYYPISKADSQISDKIYEAENSDFVGETFDDKNCSNGQYLQITDNNYAPNTHVIFTIEIETAGFYNILVNSRGSETEKNNIVEIDGELIQKYLTSTPDIFTEIIFYQGYFFEKGIHTFEILPLHGWIGIDYLKLNPAELIDYENMFNVTQQLSNQNASASARKLYSFLKSTYGNYILSGQHTENGMQDNAFQKIIEQTGKAPAILGLDLMNYSSFFDIYGEYTEVYLRTSISSAIEFASVGGIVTFCWHWVAPEPFLKKDNDGEYLDAWQGYRTQYVDLDLMAIMTDQSSDEYLLLLNDIDILSERLKVLLEYDIPILFRPLHEASGGWFWWGSGGADAYIELWKLMYERMTIYHGLNNLIWVWNGQNKDWYPGDEYVDIIGEDIYTTAKDYDEHAEQFAKTINYSNSPKITALTENGTLFNINGAIKSDSMWAWFLNWHGIHAIPGTELSQEYSTLEMWQKVYNHENVLTLDEIPFHSHIDNNGDNICEYCGASINVLPDETNNPTMTYIIIFSVLLIVIVAVVILFAIGKSRKNYK